MNASSTSQPGAAIKGAISKLAALAILAVVVAGVWNWIVRPLAARLSDAQDRIEVQRELLGRLIAKAKDDAAAINQQSSTATGTAERSFLPGENDSIRISGLQSVLNTAARAANIRLASTRTLEAAERAGVRLLGVQTQLSTDLEQLQKFLLNLEKQQSNLLVDALHIARSPQAAGQGLAALDVTVSVYGAAPAMAEPSAKVQAEPNGNVQAEPNGKAQTEPSTNSQSDAEEPGAPANMDQP